MNWIDEAKEQTPEQLRTMSLKLEELARQRQDVETQLYRAPPNDVIHPLIQAINELHNEQGVLQERYRSSEKEIERLKNELKRITW